jgi:hypothetical protein
LPEDILGVQKSSKSSKNPESRVLEKPGYFGKTGEKLGENWDTHLV